MKSDAKSESQSIRAIKTAGECSPNPDSVGSPGQDGKRSRVESISLVGVVREGGGEFNSCRSVSGGIIAQLIRFEEDRLSEAEACIEWYQGEKEKVQRRLIDLRELQRLEQADREH